VPSDLKKKAIHAVTWTFIEAIGLRCVQFVVGIILARLLLPEQFGLIGMLTIFIAVAQAFMDSGFGAALVQRQNVTEKDINSIFYFNIFVSIIAAVCLCGIAPWVAIFYNQPILTPLLRLMSSTLVINALSLVQNVLLRKALDFKTQTKVSLVASLLSGIIGVNMAYRGFGVWSLAVQQLSAAVIGTSLLWVLTSWRPAWLFSLQSLRDMFGFGSKLFASGLVSAIFENIYLIVIGKVFSPADLGYFTRADNLQKLPSLTLSRVISRVTFPVFSTIQDDPERVKRGMKKALTTLSLINFPLMIGLAGVARPLVIVLLTEKWLPCIPYLQLLCIVGLMYPLQGTNLYILSALGRSDLYLWLQIINKMLIVINIAVTWRWGIMNMITGQVIISIGSYFINSCYNKRLLDYSISEQIKDIFPYLMNALLMGGVVYAITYMSIQNPLILLISQILIGGTIYILLCQISRLPVFIEFQQQAGKWLSFKTIH